MRQIGERALWIGNAGSLQDARRILQTGIEAVVELADCEPFATLPRHLIRCRFPLSEGGENPPAVLRLAAETVAGLLRAEIPVLICCSAGLSRSVCMAAAGLVIAEGVSMKEAIAEIVDGHPADISPALFAELKAVL